LRGTPEEATASKLDVRCFAQHRESAEWFGPMEESMYNTLCNLRRDEQGQDIAEYAVMLAVILVIVVGTIRLIGTKSNTVFSEVASSVN
jgi:Flp pilus assembly pilin Flp